MLRQSFLVIAFFGCVLSSQAQAEFRWYADAQFAVGGDELAEVDVEYYDGDIESESIDAGEGFSFSVGTRFDLGSNFDAAVAVGYKSGGVIAGNDSADFTRKLLNAIVFYDTGRVQLGAGLTKEMGPELDLDDAGLGNYDFDDATGLLLQVGFEITEAFTLGLRHTRIEYEASDFNGPAIDGDNFALTAGFSF